MERCPKAFHNMLMCRLMPIVEPEILVDGSHSVDKCAEVTERVLTACYKALTDQKVLWREPY
jgi:fructose-bisphosphate aldolase class 1